MPRIQTKKDDRKKGGLLLPIALGGAVVATVGGLWWLRRSRGPGPAPGAVLVASTAPGQPEIT